MNTIARCVPTRGVDGVAVTLGSPSRSRAQRRSHEASSQQPRGRDPHKSLGFQASSGSRPGKKKKKY
eukprot:1121871-Prymnesium_polylepis.1